MYLTIPTGGSVMDGGTAVDTEVLREDTLVDVLAEQIGKASEDESSVSLAVVDMDDFGKLNEEYGTQTGDEILELVSSQLKEIAEENGAVLRKAVFRRGGDEYILLFPGMEKEEAFLLMERARASFSGDHTIGTGGKSLTIPLTFSAAVATYPEDGTRPQDVLRKAFDALYRAKSGGRNKVCLAKEERMVTKTSHYTQPQLARLSILAKREGVGEAVLLREALDDLLNRYGV
jgi:diguanylate cyclase (GGDEF)-like protein